MLSYSISLFLKKTNILIKYKTEQKHKKCQYKAYIHNIHKHNIRNHCSQAKDQGDEKCSKFSGTPSQ